MSNWESEIISLKYEYQLDEKNRLRLPFKLKEVIGDMPVLTIGNEGSLRIMPKEKAIEMKNKLMQLSNKDKKGQALARYIFENTMQIKEDAQGRFMITEELKKLARIDKSVLFLGKGNYIELWSKESYASYYQTNIKPIVENISELMEEYEL